MKKLLINAAITGMVKAKKDNPNVPITVKEIVACVKAALPCDHVLSAK